MHSPCKKVVVLGLDGVNGKTCRLLCRIKAKGKFRLVGAFFNAKLFHGIVVTDLVSFLTNPTMMTN